MKRSFIICMRSDDMPPNEYEGAIQIQEVRGEAGMNKVHALNRLRRHDTGFTK